MAERARIGLREVRALEANAEVWDTDVPGFGARRQIGPGVSYILLFRTAEGRQRRHTIGRHGKPWTPDTARKEALRLLGEVVKGTDPAADKKAKRQAPTVNDLLDDYWRVAESGTLMTRRRAPKKASTLLSDKGRIDKHIRPVLGAMKVASVTAKDVEKLMSDIINGKTAAKQPTGKKRGMSNVRGGKGVATRTIGLLGAIFSYAVKQGMRADNPVHGIVRPADGRKERRLSDDEYAAMGTALAAAADVVWPAAVAATRFLLLTGWRSGEALTLRWQDVDLPKSTATLRDTKTGASVRALSTAACQVLRSLPRAGDLVFPATRGEGPMAGFPSMFRRIADLGKLPADITPHVLRHSFASLAGDLEFSEATIGTLLGHRQHTTTSKYVHRADRVLLAAADAVANETLERLGEAPKGGDVVQFQRQGAAA